MMRDHLDLLDDLVCAVRALEESGPHDDGALLVHVGPEPALPQEHDTIVTLRRDGDRLLVTFSVETPAPGVEP